MARWNWWPRWTAAADIFATVKYGDGFSDNSGEVDADVKAV